MEAKLRKERTTAKGQFNRKVTLFDKSLNNKDHVTVLRDLLDEVNDKFDQVEAIHEKLLLIDPIDVQELDTYINNIEEIKIKTKNSFLSYKESHSKDDQNAENLKFCVKKLSSPFFEGDIRTYPSFRSDFTRLMESRYGQDPFVLKSALSKNVLLEFNWIDDYKVMWDRLDEKFGSAAKVVDYVISDIKGLKSVPEGNSPKLLELINVLERGWYDLKRVGKEKEIENVTVITLIEKLLPPNIMREWALKRPSFDDDKLFAELSKFLINERKVIEYTEDRIRKNTSGNKINVHNVSIETSQCTDESNCDKNKEIDSEYIKLFKHIQDNQASRDKQINETLSHLTLAFNNLAKLPNQSPNSNIIGASSKWCFVHQTAAHDFTECINFKRMDKLNKMDCLRRNRVCFSCLESGHVSSYCNSKNTCKFRDQMGNLCGRNHHTFLHDVFFINNFIVAQQTSVTQISKLNSVILPIGIVKCNGYPISTLYDSGASLSVISHHLAQYLGLKGDDIELSIVKVGNTIENIKSKIYYLTLFDLYGTEWYLNVIGLDQITTDHSYVNIREIAKHLEVNESDISRPKGRVDLLIGVDYCSLLPQVVKTKDNLQLLQNSFGFCVRGVTNSFGVNHNKFHHINFGLNHMTCNTTNDILIHHNKNFENNVEEFFTIENMGVECNPRCGGCRCGKCLFGDQLSIKDHREMNLIIEGLSYDYNGRKWTVTYPWIREPNELPNNFSLAFSCLKSTERRLSKLGLEYSIKYNDQIQDMLNRGVAFKLDKSSINNYKGPVHYLPHHEIHKPSSSSTPLRIVFNPSIAFAGHVLNDYYAKGPDVLNDMIGVLLRFRLGSIAVVGDIKKMYNAIFLSLLDQHTHRFLWRNMNINQDPDHYILSRVTFGDRPSGAIAIIALRKTAEMFKNKFPESTSILIDNSYVDDLIFSVDSMSVAESRMSEIEHILAEGGFHIKEWNVSNKEKSSNHAINIVDKDEEKVLGILWNSETDKFKFQINLNFSKNRFNIKPDSSIKESDFSFKFPKSLTKRMIMSQIASLYDPLGLLTPFTLQAKLLMRELILEQRSHINVSDKEIWDIHIHDQLYTKWKSYFFNMFKISCLTFERCVKPRMSFGKPMLILFSDGSKCSYGSCAYIRWKLENGTFFSSLLLAKSRLAPTKQLTIPRIELNGCVISCRLRQKIVLEMKSEFESIIHIIDSSIVLSQISNESSKFQTYVANRLAEIHRKSHTSEWFWTSSENNIADHTTRFLDPSEMGSDSTWQCGPRFLSLPFDMWPIKKSFQSIQLPDLLKESQTVNISFLGNNISKEVESVIDIHKFNNVNKLLRVTARIINVKNNKSLKHIFVEPTAEHLKRAESYWIKQVQAEIMLNWEKQYKRLGPKCNEEGIIVVGDRLKNWLKDNWNQSEFILLTPHHPFTKLYIQFLHDEDHAGIETTRAKLQSKFWVPRANKIIKFIKLKCIKCRVINKKCIEQCMGPLPENRLKPSPPFYNTSLDLFGPFLVKDTVKRRTTKKVYGLICTCMTSRAVHLELVEGYDMSNFLLSFRRFVSIRGFPRFVYSDNGSQLVAANKELREMTRNWDISEFSKFGSKQGMSWIFNKSANAPFQNGCSESLIRLVKRGILMSIGDNILSFGKLLTTIHEISNLINSRPIGSKPGNDLSLGTYLCPNDLILGRNNVNVPNEVFDESYNDYRRYQFVNKVVTSFWKKWNRDFFHTLIIRQKWHVKTRNVKIGDIVLVQDTNSLKGKWKLAQVVETFVGSDSIVRNVTIRYKLNKPGMNYNGQADSTVNRSVHSLVIILPVEEQ